MQLGGFFFFFFRGRKRVQPHGYTPCFQFLKKRYVLTHEGPNGRSLFSILKKYSRTAILIVEIFFTKACVDTWGIMVGIFFYN